MSREKAAAREKAVGQRDGHSSPYVAVLAGHCHILLCDVNIHVIQSGLLCYVVGTDKVQPIRGLAGQARPSEGTLDRPLP